MTPLFAVVAAAGNLVGGGIVLHFDSQAGLRYAVDRQQRILHRLLHIGAGFLLAVTLLEMIPSALKSIHPVGFAAPIILGGYLFIYFIETMMSPHVHTVPGAGDESSDHGDTHRKAHGSSTALSPRTVFTMLIGLAIHSFFDGVAIGSGEALSYSLGFLLLVAIVLHKIPEGATVGSLALLAGLNRRTALLIPMFLGAATIVGFFVVSLLKIRMIGPAMGLAAGVTLYIAATDLVPHARENRTIRSESMMLFVGVALFALTDFLLRLLGLS